MIRIIKKYDSNQCKFEFQQFGFLVAELTPRFELYISNYTKA